ncbi:hypothetical protein RRG08_028786 [Elysia crispata]|uniref:Uncharacterized protein n=1 Tax=Elysia crispata TaxID=231223 RepID=A0AAE0XUA0_9GAST|nr:hypothetical protein RRG08_028786 [Elysia crispata]
MKRPVGEEKMRNEVTNCCGIYNEECLQELGAHGLSQAFLLDRVAKLGRHPQACNPPASLAVTGHFRDRLNWSIWLTGHGNLTSASIAHMGFGQLNLITVDRR